MSLAKRDNFGADGGDSVTTPNLAPKYLSICSLLCFAFFLIQLINFSPLKNCVDVDGNHIIDDRLHYYIGCVVLLLR